MYLYFILYLIKVVKIAICTLVFVFFYLHFWHSPTDFDALPPPPYLQHRLLIFLCNRKLSNLSDAKH